MSDVNTTIAPNEIDNAVAAELRGVMDAKGKLAEVPLASIAIENAENLRFFAGQNVDGVIVEKDLRGIDDMVSQIRGAAGLTTPPILHKQADGSFHILCGFRRMNAVKRIVDTEPSSPLAKSFKTIRCMVYENLTPSQIDAIKNDQTSLHFHRAEVFREFARQLRGGQSWYSIARRMVHQIARVTDSSVKLREYLELTDPAKAQEFLKSWLNSTVGQYWANGVTMGDYVYRFVLQQYMVDDGSTSQKPYVKLKAGAEFNAVWSAWKKDRDAGQLDPVAGTGPLMLAQIEKIREKQTSPPTPKDFKFKSVDTFKALLAMQESRDGQRVTMVRSILECAREEGTAIPQIEAVHTWEVCSKLYASRRAELSPALQTVLDAVLRTPNAKLFAELIGTTAPTFSPPTV